jgi:hypothetical protein
LTFPLQTTSIAYGTILAQSAVELSKEIVSGGNMRLVLGSMVWSQGVKFFDVVTESSYLVPRLDLQEHLLTRVSALKALLECIYKNGLSSQVCTGLHWPLYFILTMSMLLTLWLTDRCKYTTRAMHEL